MAVSLRRGVTALEPDVDALMISLGDQPGMLAEAYRAVVSRWRTSRSSIVVPRYADASGPAHPTLFASEVFSELLALDGDVGARSVVARDPSRVTEATLEWRAPRDVDTLDDLDSLLIDLMSARQSAHQTTYTDSAPPNTIP
jgi:molybdenum cofactor cytidylyltransferase